MATEFARRLAAVNVRRARQAIVDIEFTHDNVDKLSTLLTNYRRAVHEQRAIARGDRCEHR